MLVEAQQQFIGSLIAAYLRADDAGREVTMLDALNTRYPSWLTLMPIRLEAPRRRGTNSGVDDYSSAAAPYECRATSIAIDRIWPRVP